MWSGCCTPACRCATMPGLWLNFLPPPSLPSHAAVPCGGCGGCLRALQGGARAAGMAGRHRRLPAAARKPAAAPQRHRPAANVRLGRQSGLYPNSSSPLCPLAACCALRHGPICCAAACSGHPHSHLLPAFFSQTNKRTQQRVVPPTPIHGPVCRTCLYLRRPPRYQVLCALCQSSCAMTLCSALPSRDSSPALLAFVARSPSIHR